MLAAAEGRELVEGYQIGIVAEVDRPVEEYEFEVAVAGKSQIAGREDLIQRDEEDPREAHLEGVLETVAHLIA